MTRSSEGVDRLPSFVDPFETSLRAVRARVARLESRDLRERVRVAWSLPPPSTQLVYLPPDTAWPARSGTDLDPAA
jgi:hypothetical protein